MVRKKAEKSQEELSRKFIEAARELGCAED
jgi:hypothetical protein